MKSYIDAVVEQGSCYRRETQILAGERWGGWTERELSVWTLAFKYVNIYFPAPSTVRA